MKLDKKTLEWVIRQIDGYLNDDYYEYCSAIESLKTNIECKIEEREKE